MSRPLDIAIYSPAGVLYDGAALDRAVQRLLALGHRVVEDRSARARFQRFAGDDDTRLAAIARVAAREDVDVAMAVRGGYGWTRLLDRLDYASLAAARKRWLGHSDFTAFELAMLARTGQVTYAGPMAAYDFGGETTSEYSWRHCFDVLDGTEHEVECALDGPALDADGTLWGGNLAMVAHLVGTPHLPAIDGGVLFLEDVGEHPYRVERMLHQLAFAGVLARQRAILLGAFTEYTLYPHDDGYDMPAVVERLRTLTSTPVYTGLPFGHVRDKLTLPVGGRVRLEVRPSSSRLVLSDYR